MVLFKRFRVISRTFMSCFFLGSGDDYTVSHGTAPAKHCFFQTLRRDTPGNSPVKVGKSNNTKSKFTTFLQDSNQNSYISECLVVTEYICNRSKETTADHSDHLIRISWLYHALTLQSEVIMYWGCSAQTLEQPSSALNQWFALNNSRKLIFISHFSLNVSPNILGP